MAKKYKSNTKKRSFSFRLSILLAKLSCINPLILSNTNELRFSYRSLVCGIFLIACYFYIWYFILLGRLETFLPGETPIAMIVSFISLGDEFLEILQLLVLFGFYQNRIKLVVKSFVKAEKTSIKLGIRIDYEKYYRNLTICLTVIPISYISWLIVTNGLKPFEQIFTTVLWILYLLPQVPKLNRWTIFLWSFRLVKQKFQRLNEKVRLLMQNNDVEVVEGNGGSSRLFITNPKARFNPVLLDDKIHLIAQLHRELRDIIHGVVDHVAVSIVLSLLSHFLNITICVHIAYRFLKGRRQLSLTDVVYLIYILSWIFFAVILMVLISNICGSTVDEANETGKILHATINSNNFRKVRGNANFKMLSLDLLQNRLSVSVLGLLDLNYDLVYKVISTVTTLLVIMLQFYN